MNWSENLAMDLGREALRAFGLESASLTMLKFGDIAIFRVENPSRFLKIGNPDLRSLDAIFERSLRLSAWLDANGIPVAAAAEEGFAEPVAVGGTWAALWRWEDARDERADPESAGALLRRVHDVLADCPVPLPELDQFDLAVRHVAQLPERSDLDESAIEFLAGKAEWMQREWARFGSELGTGAIHGDMAVDNVLTTTRGPVLIDLDDAQIGPREWDLVKVTPGSPGGWTAEEWPEFARGYGYDMLSAPANDLLRDVRHLRTLVWLFSNRLYAARLERANRLLAEWVADPEKRCSDLDWAAQGVKG